MASSSSLTTSEVNHPPVTPSKKKTSNGYPHHPNRKTQAEEEDVKKGSNSSNPWGKGSYSDLITRALMSSPERKMTLDEIYRWITVNIPYFRNKGEEISSSGWKVLKANSLYGARQQKTPFSAVYNYGLYIFARCC